MSCFFLSLSLSFRPWALIPTKTMHQPVSSSSCLPLLLPHLHHAGLRWSLRHTRSLPRRHLCPHMGSPLPYPPTLLPLCLLNSPAPGSLECSDSLAHRHGTICHLSSVPAMGCSRTTELNHQRGFFGFGVLVCFFFFCCCCCF